VKRSDLYIRVTTGVLFLAIASYIGVYLFNMLTNTYETTAAVNYSIEETFSATGYVVRSETVLADAGAAALPIVKDGEKVASGQVVAVEYTSREAIETASEIRALRLQIAQLETTGSSIGTIRLGSVLTLARAVQSGDLSSLDGMKLDIETYVFSMPGVAPKLPELQERLQELEQRNAGLREISAPVSGIFSQTIDGYENVGPRALSDITPSGLTGLFSVPSGLAGAGKLVTEFRWYFAAAMSAEDAARLSAGRSITVQFSGAYNASVDMTVESVGKKEEDKCVVLFTCDKGVHDLAATRQLRAEIVFNVVSGIRVPKEAIHLDDNAVKFVYLQTGVRAERVDVEILHESGDIYIVRDGLETGSPLRAGSTIIVKANNLFDGKVVA